MILCCDKIMHDYATLQDYYEMNVVPLLNQNNEIPDTGAEWTFQYLALCKLVAPDKYDELKSIIVPQFTKLYKRGEPNVKYYYPRLNEILSYLENNDIRKG